MEKQLIISISREYGSGGHNIARHLAERFELPIYDHNLLDEIVADKKIRLSEQKKEIDLQAMRRLAVEREATGRSFYDNLKKDGISIIGEFKKASPSLGKIESKINLTERIDEYNS